MEGRFRKITSARKLSLEKKVGTSLRIRRSGVRITLSAFLAVSGVPFLQVEGADDWRFALFAHLMILDGVSGLFLSFELHFHKRSLLFEAFL